MDDLSVYPSLFNPTSDTSSMQIKRIIHKMKMSSTKEKVLPKIFKNLVENVRRWMIRVSVPVLIRSNIRLSLFPPCQIWPLFTILCAPSTSHLKLISTLTSKKWNGGVLLLWKLADPLEIHYCLVLAYRVDMPILAKLNSNLTAGPISCFNRYFGIPNILTS